MTPGQWPAQDQEQRLSWRHRVTHSNETQQAPLNPGFIATVGPEAVTEKGPREPTKDGSSYGEKATKQSQVLDGDKAQEKDQQEAQEEGYLGKADH